ncbi:MAG: hypothetical protein RL145_2124, partial [Pseudomonadota bacterium]
NRLRPKTADQQRTRRAQMLKSRIDRQSLHAMRRQQTPAAQDQIWQGDQPLEEKGCD